MFNLLYRQKSNQYTSFIIKNAEIPEGIKCSGSISKRNPYGFQTNHGDPNRQDSFPDRHQKEISKKKRQQRHMWSPRPRLPDRGPRRQRLQGA